ncbi:MAG: thioredoxin family protein [Ferruginibacter sp.]|nr:thioredoxin family protein [Ferruginibacter sp.]
MKKVLLFMAVAAGLATMSFTINAVLPIGSALPKADLKMKDVSGKEVSIKDASKKNGVLVIFSCNTCPYVVKNEQRILGIGDFALKMNVGVILLNSNEAQRTSDDSYEEMKKYAAEKKYNWSYVVDKNYEVADAFGANRTPECFLFDKNLKLVYHGAIDDNPSNAAAVTRSHLRVAINELVEGKEIAVKESKSVGCTIKRN